MIDYEFTSNYVYAPIGRGIEIKPSTSADGWKYHKPSKKRKKK